MLSPTSAQHCTNVTSKLPGNRTFSKKSMMEMSASGDSSETEAFVPNVPRSPYNAKSKQRNSMLSSPSGNAVKQYFRRAQIWICYSNRNKIILLAFLSFSATMLTNQFQVHRTKKLAKGAVVSMDYSNVKSVGDLEAIKNELDSLCFVSLSTRTVLSSMTIVPCTYFQTRFRLTYIASIS